MQHLLNFYIIVMCLLLFFSFAVVMHFIHELLARILRATLIPRYDFNKLIDSVNYDLVTRNALAQMRFEL